LYIETVKRAHSCMSKEMEIDDQSDLSPAQQLERFIRSIVPEMHAPASPNALKLMMRELAHPGKAASVVVDEFIRPMALHLVDIMRELLPHYSEQQRLMTGFSIIGQCLYYRQNRPVSELIFGKDHLDALTADAVADHVVRFSLAALGLAAPITAENP